MSKDYILGIDQGSTGSKVIIVDRDGRVVCSAYRRIQSYYPSEGWLEHDPNEIWESVKECLIEASRKFDFSKVRAIGITNQRETSILWERNTGKAVTPAISWQCTRSQRIIDGWDSFADEINQKTGLVNSTYYSASKIVWMFENDPTLCKRAEQGELMFGTINSWVLWNLTGFKSHLTDTSNAARTLFFDVHDCCWDQSLMTKMGIPEQILPQVVPCDAEFGMALEPQEAFSEPIPVRGMIGDQMSALLGQGCISRGHAKCTIGTCLNLVTYTGAYEEPKAGILPAVATDISGKVSYELEGAVFVAGSINEWLIEQLEVAKTPIEVAELAASVPSTDGVYFVPAFQGLAAPHWNNNARAIIVGLSRFHNKRHICRAALESIAFQTNDVLETLRNMFDVDIQVLRVDGGVAKSDFVMQLFADILGCKIERPVNTDCTPLGAVYMAGLASGLWCDLDQIARLGKMDKFYTPSLPEDSRQRMLTGWKEAVARSLDWVK